MVMETAPVKKSTIGHLTEKLMSALLTICTTAVIGCFAFLWKINGEFAHLQERDINKEEKISHLQSDMNNIRLDQQIMKDNQMKQTGQLEVIRQYLNVNKKR
jgi:hypothetical protein